MTDYINLPDTEVIEQCDAVIRDTLKFECTRIGGAFARSYAWAVIRDDTKVTRQIWHLHFPVQTGERG